MAVALAKLFEGESLVIARSSGKLGRVVMIYEDCVRVNFTGDYERRRAGPDLGQFYADERGIVENLDYYN